MIERAFVCPNDKICLVAAKWFAAFFGNGGRSDFSDTMCVVPTRSAGRLFAEGLEKFLGEAAALPRITTLEDAMARVAAKTGFPELDARAEAAVWLKVLPRLSETLFPAEARTGAGRLESLASFREVAAALAENGMSFADARDKAVSFADGDEGAPFERVRWSAYADAERLINAEARSAGFITHRAAFLEAQRNPVEDGIKTLVYFGSFDISPVAEKFMTAYDNAGVGVVSVVFAPEEDKNLFDAFGRPKDGIYGGGESPVPLGNIRPVADCREQADYLRALAKAYGTEGSRAVLGIACDCRGGQKLITNALLREGVRAEVPEPETLSKTSIASFAEALGAFCDGFAWRTFASLLENAVVLKLAEKYALGGEGKLFAEADEISKEFIPYSIDGALEGAEKLFGAESAIHAVARFFKPLETGLARGGAKLLLDVMGKILDTFLPDAPAAEKRAAQVLLETLGGAVEAEGKFGVDFEVAELFGLVKSALSQMAKSAAETSGKPARDVDLQDWVEIFWSAKAHIVLCDFNDGIVPMPNSASAAVSDTLRAKFGMRTQRARCARDSAMLKALALSRRGYRLDVIVPKTDFSGNPVPPSRTLLRSADCAKFVKKLFFNPSAQRGRAPFSAPWSLDFGRHGAPQKYSASALNAYLKSPFVYFVKYVLRAESREAFKADMDALQTGLLFHEIMEAFGKSQVAASADGAEIAEFLDARLKATAAEHFGNSPRAQVRFQLDSLRIRLAFAARIQAAHRAQGWRIKPDFCERNFSFDFCGKTICGKIDRVDENENTGELFVLDYKTFDKASSGCAREEHIGKSGGAKETQWRNFQLPIYMMALPSVGLGARRARCGYFCAPKDSADARIDEWADVAAFLDGARAEMERVIELIEGGEFGVGEKALPPDLDGVFNMDSRRLAECVRFGRGGK